MTTWFSQLFAIDVAPLQGTLYPDVIESCPPPGSGQKHSHTIKSHHNVGGLPKDLDFTLIEPLRELFKVCLLHSALHNPPQQCCLKSDCCCCCHCCCCCRCCHCCCCCCCCCNHQDFPCPAVTNSLLGLADVVSSCRMK